MCGIAGIVSKRGGIEDAPHKAATLVHALQHRGPDGCGYYSDGDVLLAHARLSIIDIAGGRQPIHNADKTVWVTFNGEIYNFVELRAQLESKGYPFYTSSDTEVLVHLYDEYGEDFVSYLNGQFAIGLWDSKQKKLLLARDRAGIAPLFYSDRAGEFVFASEAKAILAVAGVGAELDLQGLDQLLTFWSTIPPRTVFKGINSLPPGHLLVYQNARFTTKPYWSWRFPNKDELTYSSIPELVEELDELLSDAVRIRLRADVPVGAYLSGGLDSSLLAAMMRKECAAPLRTFSISFGDKAHDESAYQDKMKASLGVDHSRLLCADRAIAENFIESLWYTESPILRTAPIPMGMLSGLVRNSGYKVVMTGEGADEVFGGYDLFKEAKIRSFWAAQPNSDFRPLLLKRLYPYLELSPGRTQSYVKNFFGAGVEDAENPFFSHLPRWNTTSKIKFFYSDAVAAELNTNAFDAVEALLPTGFGAWDGMQKSQFLEVNTLMAGYLLSSQGDRMLMKNSVEGRFPYLDHRVIEFGNRLPASLKMKVLKEKYLLKELAKRFVPAEIIGRHKQPYRAPDIPAFYSDAESEFVTELMSASSISRYGVFDVKKTEMLMKKVRAGRAIGYKDNMAFVAMLSTQAWQSMFKDGFVGRLAQGKYQSCVLERMV